jgi:hypothetical protein
MRRIIGLALLIGVFAGGYHLGRQKDSPDLIGYARQAVTAIAAVAGDVADSFSNKNEDRGGARDGYRADADASRDDRAYVDTRAYVNDGYAPQPSRYAPPEPPQPDRAQASNTEVAQAAGKSDSDWAARLWKSLQDQPAGR